MRILSRWQSAVWCSLGKFCHVPFRSKEHVVFLGLEQGSSQEASLPSKGHLVVFSDISGCQNWNQGDTADI